MFVNVVVWAWSALLWVWLVGVVSILELDFKMLEHYNTCPWEKSATLELDKVCVDLGSGY